ncbi:NAD(P)/FAD-dependent oxidoreductase [Marinobacter litoralis]|uniref:NAD(P)/FAD-dependent oxidoreductase n=1 Tax=Marinobacter litoralis TaxID=187981 RepID=UPI0018EACB9B|nr:FAD-dependent oxidoreductase [Marinobacter litoralis]MBJ6136218.1 NAD(P)/FAD-dependent oxidoreductase [Marinobacter litoralis]
MTVCPNAPLVICGHGMVAQRLIENLIANGHPYSKIVVFNGEPVSAYNRIQLSSLLANEIAETDLALKPDDWFSLHQVEVHNHEPVSRIDVEHHRVVTARGRIQPYSKLILATGSTPSSLGLPGEALDGVLMFRSLADTRAMIDKAGSYRRAVVIGGGFLGLEAAEGLRARGMAVTVLHRSNRILNRQLDPTSGKMLKDLLEQRGLTVLTGYAPKALLGKHQIRAVQLHDDTVLATDLVVIATGITPNAQLAAEAGLRCDRGICIDSQMRTSTPSIYALGECSQFGNETFGLVEPGFHQAQTLAEHLCQQTDAQGFVPVQIPTRLKISGIPIYSCGQVEPGPDTQTIQWRDRPKQRYGRLLIEHNRLVGAMLLGDTANGTWYTDLIRSAQDITDYRNTIAFGKPYCEAAA